MTEIILSGVLLFDHEKKLNLLHRIKHDHYETPGGKVEEKETIKQASIRELYEELDGFVVNDLQYIGEVSFKTPDDRKAIAHKFIAIIKNGKPEILETELFSKVVKLDKNQYLNSDKISPDLKLFRQNPELNQKILEYF